MINLLKNKINNLAYSGFYLASALINPDTSADLQRQVGAFKGEAGLTDDSIGNVLAMVVKAFLSVLGIIFIILIVLAGYNWMTAAGNEEKVTKAKNTITRAIIGLIIIVSAYAITYFVFKNLPGGGTPGGGGAGPTS